ncbi:MAG TPA: hypothetical protein HA349_06820 [Methanotrichaceae archaeon]|nr:hypothetical protein [Methanotrichaceae archaeon]
MNGPDQILEAIDTHPQGVLIRFEVSPGSNRLEIPSGFNPWRRSFEAKLTEKPIKGKANLQLTRALADLLGVPGERVQVISGQKSSRKVVLVLGLDADGAAELLAGFGSRKV